MRRISILVCFWALSGCDQLIDVEVPQNEVSTPPQTILQDRGDSIFLAAAAHLPVGDRDYGLVAVLEQGRTDKTNFVRYHHSAGSETYMFVRDTAGWSRGLKVHGGAADASRDAISLESIGYSGEIARIMDGNNTVDQWFVANIRDAGDYYRTAAYGVLPVNRGRFMPGTQLVGNTRYEVVQREWRAYRETAPFCDLFYWTAFHADFVVPDCFRTDIQRFDSNVRPHRFWLRFALRVTELPPVDFYIRNWEANDSEYRGFGLSPSQFSAPIDNVRWEVSSNGTVWAQIPHSNCGQVYAGAFRDGTGASTYMRATVTLTDGRTGTGFPQYGPVVNVDVNDVYVMC